MGAVYRAYDTRLNRTVALKVLTAAPGEPEARLRLVREARAASALNHPNVVTIHAVEQQPDFDFIVMERIDGTPLSQAVPGGGLPIDTFLDYAIQMAGALAAAHEAGIVHRDIKPGNISVTAGGLLKVFDFGIARRAARPGDETRQATLGPTVAGGSVITGTPGYLAPEQIGGQPADARSDVFSLGVVMYEMLTGRQAFPGDTSWARMDATVHRDPPPVADLRAGVPEPIIRIVRRCLLKSTGERYASATALLADLTEARAAQQRAAAGAGRWSTRSVVAAGLAIVLAAGALIGWYAVRQSRMRWARDTATAEARRLAAAGEALGAYTLLQQALAFAPDDPGVQAVWTELTAGVTLDSVPSDAEVAIRAYDDREGEWLPLGRTPTETRLPVGQLRWQFAKPGYETIEISPDYPAFTAHLPPAGETPPGMVYVPAGSVESGHDSGTLELPEYWIDRYEVTNREYKAFVDAGGYSRRDHWTEPFVKDGRTLTWEQAMAELRDTTGRPGPSTWELGTYPEGQEDYPVGGVSWYEAVAYARFAGKQLPTTHHWRRASGAFGIFSDILRVSNFSGRGPARVGGSGGLGPFGTEDMAGNVKEWCWNETVGGRRYILGGGWNEANYQFRDPDARSPFERGTSFGMRLMRQAAAIEDRLLEPIETLTRDPSTLTPVGDELFQAYRRLYDYDPIPLDSRVDEVEEGPYWRREFVSFRAAYGEDRVPAQIYIPRSGTPPYQAVIYFPGSDAVMLQSSREPWLQWVEFIVRSGRAVVYPIYQQTYERRRPPAGPNFLREISIQRGQDLRRAVDYLQTRPDVDGERIAFYGLSLGAQLGPVYLAIEPRLRTGVLLSGGFETWDVPPETDPVNFAPRVRQPVLMVNGRDDFDLPYRETQVPMFEALGSPAGSKAHVVFEGGHIPARPQEVYKVVLDWLDAKLGPVR